MEAKAGGGSATLSMGQAAARFGLSLVRAMQGKGVVECAYVEGDGHYARFFSQPLLLGKNGVEERQSIGKLSAFEQQALEGMLDTLKKISRSAKTSSTSNLALTEEPEPLFRLFIVQHSWKPGFWSDSRPVRYLAINVAPQTGSRLVGGRVFLDGDMERDFLIITHDDHRNFRSRRISAT